jgi:hypothetical protein
MFLRNVGFSETYAVSHPLKTALYTLTGVRTSYIILTKNKLNSVAVVRKRTIPTERPPLVGEVSLQEVLHRREAVDNTVTGSRYMPLLHRDTRSEKGIIDFEHINIFNGSVLT